ncbi:23S rRNA m(2)G-2445 methyltransferase [Pseudidiomarina indica]|uniref:Ribosomal RNA large subunit methyltransferase K/L n=2 Tax=Pseudidiomarina indica TaxID=1159017 RepID=A0A1G6A6Q7_9GAMM|nr:23S rRNA m(2)G-2445 methyltransferase [Pseudidiomarina indica]
MSTNKETSMSNSPKQHRLFATCAKGLEPLLFEELQQLGAEDVRQTMGGCWFQGDVQLAYRVCLWTRLANRVLLSLGDTFVKRVEDIPLAVAQTPWEDVFTAQHTFVVDFNGRSQAIRHTQFGAQLIKDGIVDRFRDAGLPRPNVAKEGADIRIHAHLHKDKLTWYLDFAGDSLHKRGYRQQQGSAPLKETLAAAIAIRSGVSTATDLVFDPFCGSGTLLLEAAMICLDRAPGLTRTEWGFQRWLGHQETVWQTLVNEAQQRFTEAQSEHPLRLIGHDLDARVLAIAEQNAIRLGIHDRCQWERRDAETMTAPALEAPAQHPHLICNPPYGERLGEEVETLLLYRRFGSQLREHFSGWQVSVLAGDDSLLKRLKLRSERKYKLFNGPIETTLALFDLTKEQLEFTKEQSTDIANRLRKNYHKLEKWSAKEGVNAWRLYDADLPDYNAAVDVYDDCLVIQEYAAPKDVPPAVAKERLWTLVDSLAQELPFAAENMTLKVRQRQTGKQQYEKQAPRGLTRIVHEYDALFEVNLSDYLDTGLFLDHRWARRELGKLSQNKAVLNLFAYTCSASVHAALGGAREVVSVDLSKTYLAWGQRNFKLNHLHGRQYQFIQADCLQWLKEQRPQQRFDVIFLDPPTFSNSKRMSDVLDTERDHVMLLKLAARLLNDNGVILFSTNKRRFKLDYEQLAAFQLVAEDLTERSIPVDFARNKGIHHLFKVRFSG